MRYVHEFLDFVKRSPSPFHAVENLAAMLTENGFERLKETEAWRLQPGKRYFVTRNRSAIAAFELPEGDASHFQITASHSDSPVFKLKPGFEDANEHYVKFNVEKYGGMILSVWLDRPLSVAGRVVVKTPAGLVSRLVNLDRDTVLIPNLPIHFNRDVNSGYNFNPQTDMLPLYGEGSAKGGLKKEIAGAAQCAEGDIVSCDLFLYNRESGSVWGAGDAFFSCERIDDLECAYTSMLALTQSRAKGHINLCAVLDNEEVGSLSKQGADSTFLRDVMTRVMSALGKTDSEARAAFASSFMVSADNAHALHPNHPEKYDAQNRVYMNGGVVVKFNANQKYTTDAVSAAVFAQVCERAGVPVQYFANRSDLPGGSTLGNLSNAQVSMNTVDIGLAQLAMHSVYETAGTKDPGYMTDALKEMFDTDIVMTDDGCFRLE